MAPLRGFGEAAHRGAARGNSAGPGDEGEGAVLDGPAVQGHRDAVGARHVHQVPFRNSRVNSRFRQLSGIATRFKHVLTLVYVKKRAFWAHSTL